MTTPFDTLADALLLTKSGRPKHRFTWPEKLQVLDPTADPETTEARLRAFQQLFAFRYTNAIITRRDQGPRSWSKLRGPLTRDHIACHLLGDRIPTRPPRWVGARSLSRSFFLCIDVDAERSPERWLDENYDTTHMLEEAKRWLIAQREESLPKPPHAKPSLEERRRQVEEAFERMGVNHRKRNEVLVQRTPSGGFHYYLFFKHRYLPDQLHMLLEELGLRHQPGQIEFFPSDRQGLRLPFGHIPGRPDRPHAWIDFIDRFRSGRIRRHSLETLWENVTAQDASWTPPPQPPTPKPTHTPTRPHNVLTLGVPKSSHTARRQCRETGPKEITSMADAEERMRVGIEKTGTRNEILKQLTAHLIWFRHKSADEATEILTDWALDPRHESVDIAYDLANGTNKVAKQIECMCRWYESKKPTTAMALGASHSEPAFTNREVEAVRASLETLPITERRQQAEFLLHFLWFAKQHGRRSEGGNSWEASPAVRPVIRRWPGCHHMNYKLRVTLAIEAGILEITRDKWNSRRGQGRARTYRLNIPPKSREDKTVSYSEALESLCPSETLGAPVEINRDDTATPTPDGEVDARDTATPSETRNNPADPKRANATTLHPTRTRIGVGSRSHQRNQEPDAAPDLPRPTHGGVQAAAIPREIRRIGKQTCRKPTPSIRRWKCAGRGHNQVIRGGRSPPPQPIT